ncbi:MAG: hypothetical protein OEV44_06110 [Spirochaetota bacterium]|nr:hypothetical protein [Spirochaetota bacterium]
MRKEKTYDLISGLVDNELTVEKKFKILQRVKIDSWCKTEYEEIKKLKETLSSISPQLLPSPDFEKHLKNKLYNQESQENWFTKLMYTGILTKVSYGMVAASIIFIMFVGVRLYNQTDLQANVPDEIASKTPASAIVENNLLTIHNGNESVRINLETGKPYSQADYEKLSHFSKVYVKDKLVSLGFQYMNKGEYDTSRELFRAFAFVKNNNQNTSIPFMDSKEAIDNRIKRVNNK